jgi:predicted alpha/beta hydrolase family esterase
MAGSSILDFRVLIVPGLHGSGSGHWQTRWQVLFPYFERVHQPNWDVPDLPVWSERLDSVLRESSQPTLIVAHSFGCLAAVHRAGLGASNLEGALLVAPADPYKFDVEQQLPRHKLPFPSLVVTSSNDPWMDMEKSRRWAARWGSEFINVGAQGHINADSGLGDWRLGLSLLRNLAATAPGDTYRGIVCQCSSSPRLLQISI